MESKQQESDQQSWLVTGGTGFIGVPLVQALVSRHYQVFVLTRKPSRLPKALKQLIDQGGSIIPISQLDEIPQTVAIHGCINLAGEGIADRPWTRKRKRILETSRIDLTRTLVNWLAGRQSLPELFLSGSAIGVYGYHQDQWLDETASVAGEDFGASLCKRWEEEAGKLAAMRPSNGDLDRLRIVNLRTGLVLGQGGMLKRMSPAFKLGLGGRLGDGNQYMSWVHLEDMVAIVLFIIDHPEISGPVNAVAESPVTNGEFTRLFANTLKRPYVFHAPAFILKLLLGEMAELLLKGQRIKPKVLIEQGYKFKFSDLQTAFTNIFKK